MQKAIIYARYSSHNQREETIETQIRICRRFAEREGYDIVGTYCDYAVSGTTDRRTEFQRMISDSKNHTFEIVLVHKLDRFSRGEYDPSIYKYLLKKQGCRVKSATEYIPDTPEGVLLEKNLEGVAAYYSLLLSARVKDGFESNALKCLANGMVRYGWDIVDGKYIINDVEAGAVKRMFKRRCAGDTYAAIANQLSGYQNKYGRPINGATVSRIIRCEAYKGVYRFGAVCIEGGIPAIVDNKLWNRAQLPTSSRKPRKHRKHMYDLVGKTFGSLRVLSHHSTDKTHHKLWLCHCKSCGNDVVVYGMRLTSGLATACNDCLRASRRL